MKILNTLLLSSLLIMSINLEAKLYKWVDEEGKTHYSDKMPPDQIKNAHEELSDQGVTKDKIARELTAEEKIAKAAEIQKRIDLEAKRKLDAELLDKERNTILMSYTSTDQIKRLKEERISAIARNIETANENLVVQEKNQEDLMRRAADKERNGEKVSAVFLSQIDQIKDQIAYQKKFIIEKTAEIESTQLKYDNDLKKYLKFTGEAENK